MRRVRERGRNHPTLDGTSPESASVVRKMFNMFQPPTAAEGFDEVVREKTLNPKP